MIGAPDGSKLIGRAEVVSRTRRASASYSCPTCCPTSGPFSGFDYGSFGGTFVGGFSLASTGGDYRDCYGNVTISSVFMQQMWVRNTAIASINPTSGYQTEVSGLSAGETSLVGEYELHEWRDDGIDCYYNYFPSGDEMPIEVRPRIDSISPERGLVGNTISVTITGQGFLSGQTSVNAGAGVAVSNVTVSSGTQLTANFAIDVNAAGGNRSVTVTVGNLSDSVDFFVQIPTTLRRFNFPPGAPNGYGPLTLTSSTNNEVRDAAGSVILSNECGVYRNLVYELVDQAGEPITQPFSITEKFFDYQGPDTTPPDLPKMITGGLVGDTIYFGRTLPNCLGPNDNESFRQRSEVTISGRIFPLTIINRIVRGRFSGEYRVDITIETP